MATSTISYLGELRTEATHLASGNQILTDAPVDNQGKGAAFSPTDLFATSLGACALTIMGIAANTHRIDLTGARAEVTKIMSSTPPRRVARIEIDFHFTNVYSEKEKSILQHAAETCPVALSLQTEITQNFHWTL